MELLQLKIWIARGSIVSIGAMIEFLSRFARTAILSRLLAPGEFGTAVALTLVITTVGLLTDVGLDKFVMVRSDEEQALAAAHVLTVIRGGLISIALLVSAPSVAAFFGVPQFSFSFAVIAAYPLIQSFGHLGIVQIQRAHNYVPQTLTLLLAQVSALIAILPATYIMRDHRAILVSFIVESVAFCVASHAQAPVPYRLKVDRTMLLAAFSFGIPLLVNGVGLALLSQFDRILVGHWFNVSTLALYAVILNMTIIPIALIARVFGTIGLAYISTKERSMLENDYVILVFVWGCVASAYALFVAATLDWLTPLVFGSHFQVTPFVHVLVVVFSFSQVVRGAPTTFLLSGGRTTTLSMLTLSSGAGLILAFLLIEKWPGFETVLLSKTVGELFSTALFFYVTIAGLQVRRATALIDIVAALGTLTVIVLALELDPQLTVRARGVVIGVGLLAIFAQTALRASAHGSVKSLLLRSSL